MEVPIPVEAPTLRYQISLRAMLSILAVCCVSLGLFPHVPVFAFCLLVVLLTTIAAWRGFGVPRSKLARFTGILVGLMVLELGAGFLAYETLGEIDSSCMRLALILNFAPLAAYRMGSRRIAWSVLLGIAVLLVLPQAWLGMRLVRLNDETREIANWAEQEKELSGVYPASLGHYRYRHWNTRQFIQFSRDADGQAFHVRFFVGTPSTSHWYSSKTGWGYYPD